MPDKFCVICDKLTDHQTHRHTEALMDRLHDPSTSPALHAAVDDETMSVMICLKHSVGAFREND